jgi:hypothetical protein
MIGRRRVLSLIGLGGAALALAGCGRKGRPVEVENAAYPHLYPFTPYPGRPAPPAAPEAPAEADADAPPPAATTDTPR